MVLAAPHQEASFQDASLKEMSESILNNWEDELDSAGEANSMSRSISEEIDTQLKDL